MRRKNIGVIVDTMDGIYQSNICYSLMKAAEKKNLNLLFMSGMATNSKENLMSEHNAVFQLLNKGKIDGMIYIISSLEIYIGREGVLKIVDMFKDIPSVSISMEIPNAKSILIDNFKSEYLLAEHMVKVHNYKRIAFISGPLKNNEAVSRYNGFKKALDDYQKPFNNIYFYEGDFLSETGIEAVNYYNQLDIEMPDAIISANDEMAIGAVIRLEELGYSVPTDIAIVGFDNIKMTKAFFPSITTFEQPSTEIGVTAIQALDDLFNGKVVADCTYLQGEIVLRGSCGCFSVINYKYDRKQVETIKPKILEVEKKYLMKHIDETENIFMNFIKPDSEYAGTLKKYIHQLIYGLISDMDKGLLEGEFIRNYSQMMSYANSNIKIQIDWHLLMMEFRHYLFMHITNRRFLYYIEDEFILVSMMNGSNMSRQEAMNQFMFKKMYVESRSLIMDLNSTRNFTELKKVLKTVLLSYKISECYICIYDAVHETKTYEPVALPERVKLILGINKGVIEEDLYFNRADILPEQYFISERNINLVFFSLFINQYQYGYIAFSIDAIDMLIYETLRSLISNVIKSQDLYQRRADAEEELEHVVKELEISNKKLYNLSVRDELTGLYNRRGFYLQVEKLKKDETNGIETGFVLFADIDGLKIINDTFGHREGDYAISTAAKIFKKHFAEEDIIARMSGDEFTAVSVKPKTKEDIIALIALIQQEFAEHNRTSGKQFNVSMSIGYAGFSSKNEVVFDEIIRLADEDLYEEKKKKKKNIIK